MNNELINDKINILVERAKIARDEYQKNHKNFCKNSWQWGIPMV